MRTNLTFCFVYLILFNFTFYTFLNLQILYQDEHLVAINKPNGLAVHKSKLVGNTNEFALQLLRDQIRKRVYPAHRLDRKTSGVMLFTLAEKVSSMLQKQFMERNVSKNYLAIVRGYTETHEVIDYPLTNYSGKVQEAITEYSRVASSELDLPYGKHETSRYSLISLRPKTGRTHQIRKHMNHIRHPIIGDRPHGCNKQNKLFKNRWEVNTMMLHASEIEFSHPITNKKMLLKADLPNEFKRTLKILSLNFTST